MDDQDQNQPLSSDSSASQAQTKLRAKNSAKTGQPTPVQKNVPSTQSAQSLADERQPEQLQPRPTRQLPIDSPQPLFTRQLPQPIVFTEVDVLEEEQIPARPQSTRRSRIWRIVVPLLTLLLGVAIGLTALLWYGLSAEGPLVIVPSTAQGNLIIEADKDFVTQLVRKDLTSAGLPGQVENVSVDLDHGAKMVVQGDDLYTVFGVTVSRHFTVNVQPYVQDCMLQIRVLSANLGGIPVTSFVQSFQGGINQQLAAKPAGLPSGFTYCTVGVRTEPGGMFITYQATAATATP